MQIFVIRKHSHDVAISKPTQRSYMYLDLKVSSIEFEVLDI